MWENNFTISSMHGDMPQCFRMRLWQSSDQAKLVFFFQLMFGQEALMFNRFLLVSQSLENVALSSARPGQGLLCKCVEPSVVWCGGYRSLIMIGDGATDVEAC